MSRPRQVRKRDGRLVPFHREKIAEAIFRAAQSVGGEDRFLADELAGIVTSQLARPRRGRSRGRADEVPTIEDVQDAVERVLMASGHSRTAKAYILYRNRRAHARLGRARLRQESEARAALDRAEVGTAPTSPLAPAPLASTEGDQVETTSPAASASMEGPSGGAMLPDVIELAQMGEPAEGDVPALGTGLELDVTDPASPRWSKRAIVEALVREDGITRIEAEDVARVVEARLLSSRVPRHTPALVRSLVTAEMFARGHASVLCEDTRTGLERTVLDEALASGLTDRRATNPAGFSEGVGETLIARHLFDHTLPPPVTDAHREGDVWVYDPGAPLRLTSIALDAPRTVGRHLAGQAFTHGAGALRLAAAIDEVVLRYAPFAARALGLENLNVLLAPFFAHLDEDGLRDAVRHVLLSPGLRWRGGRSHVGRGGLLRLEVGLTVDVPLALRDVETPAPAPPGRTYGDYRDAALRMTRAILKEVVALTREGHRIDTSFDLILPRPGAGDATQRALEAEVLRTAAEIGEPLVVLAPPDEALRGTRWFRLSEPEAPDPLWFDRGDVSAASATAINLVSAALKTAAGAAGTVATDDFLREAERLLLLGLDVAQARHALLERACRDPGGTLYAIQAGRHPVVDLEGAHHLIEVVGLDQAVSLLARRTGEPSRRALRDRLLVHLGRRLAQEAVARRLHAVLVEGVSDEASLRFAELDRERYVRTRRWWADDEVPSYRPRPDLGRRVEGAALERSGREATRRRVWHRVDPEQPPPSQELSASLADALADPTVVEWALVPWPRRQVRFVRGRGAR